MNLPKTLIIDKRGKPKGVILKISEYNKLLRLIEELEDALDLKNAVETASEFISHKELLEQLKEKGIL